MFCVIGVGSTCLNRQPSLHWHRSGCNPFSHAFSHTNVTSPALATRRARQEQEALREQQAREAVEAMRSCVAELRTAVVELGNVAQSLKATSRCGPQPARSTVLGVSCTNKGHLVLWDVVWIQSLAHSHLYTVSPPGS